MKKQLEEIKKVGVRTLRGNEQEIEGDLVLKERKVYMLKIEELRLEITWLHHDMLVAGHRGRWKIMELVTRNYQQPEVTKNMGEICRRIQFVSKDEEQNRDTSRKVDGK